MMSIIETIAAKKEKMQQQTIDLQNIKRQSNVTTTQNTDRLIYLQQIRFLLCQSCFGVHHRLLYQIAVIIIIVFLHLAH